MICWPNQDEAKRKAEDAKWVDNDKKASKKSQKTAEKQESAAAAAERKVGSVMSKLPPGCADNRGVHMLIPN